MIKINFLLSTLLMLHILTTATAQWSEFVNLHTYTINVEENGNVYAAGRWGGTGSETPLYMAKWNGINWTPLDSSLVRLPFFSGFFKTSALDSLNNIYIAGSFKNSEGKYCVGKWNGTNWVEVGTGSNSLSANSQVAPIFFDNAGNLYATGSFTNSSGFMYVAKWNGVSWSEMGTGTNSLTPNSFIKSICADNEGNIYAAGNFTNADGYRYVAKWNGSNWSELGSGVNSLEANDEIFTICADDSGNIYAGGRFRNSNNKCYVAKWDGITWSELGSGNGNDTIVNGGNIDEIKIDPTGNIYASIYNERRIRYFNNYIAKWNGSSWSELGGTNSLSTDDNMYFSFDLQGNLYTSGAYKPGVPGFRYYCAKYTGAYNATYTTVQNGDWNNPTTWLGGKVPHKGAIVIAAHNININIPVICYSITVQAGGNITVLPGIQFTILH